MSDFLSAAEYRGPGEINLIYRQADEIGRLRAERDASRAEAGKLSSLLHDALRGGEILQRERDDARAGSDRLSAEIGRLVKERDDLAGALGGFVYHLPGGGTVTITPGR